MFDDFSVSQAIDIDKVKASFQAKGRVEITDFLGDGQAEELRASLIQRSDWTLVLNAVSGFTRSNAKGLAK